MKPNEYRNTRALYFEFRNFLEPNNFKYHYYYFDAMPLAQRYEESKDPTCKALIDYFHEKKGEKQDLWYIGHNTWLNHDYQLDDQITKELMAGLFEFKRGIVTGPGLRYPEELEDEEKLFHPKIFLIPKNKSLFPHQAYVRFRQTTSREELEEFQRDLRELDDFFQNT